MAGSDDNEATRQKWDQRYRDSCAEDAAVSAVLTQNSQLIPAYGKALDLACGLGANALFLAARGMEVFAWDISSVAIERLNRAAMAKGITLHTEIRDVVSHPPAANSFDLITVSRFLDRAICPAIAAALKPGGLLFYQTFTTHKCAGEGPNNPHYLLAKGELRELFDSLHLCFYQEGSEALMVGRKA